MRSSSSGTSSFRSASSRAAARSSRARFPLLRELVRALELLQLAPDLGRLAVVVVDRRVGHALLHLEVGALELVDQVVEVGGHAAGQRSRASSVISGTAASAFDTGQFAFAPSRGLDERGLVEAGNAALDGERDLRDALAGLERHGRRGRRARRAACPPSRARAESAIEKHAACAAAISSSGLVLPPVASSERAAQLTSSSPIAPLVVVVIVPLPSIRLPFQVTSARRSVATLLSRRLTRAQAMTSTRCRTRGLERRSSSCSTSRSARIETSSWSSVGSRVVSRWSHMPGREQRHQHAVVLVLAGEADQLVRDAGDQRQQQDPLRDQPVPARPAEEREDEDGEHHHPEQERGAAARVDERVALHDLRLELLAGLVRVDRLVLGGVVLEHAPQVGQQRDERRGTR